MGVEMPPREKKEVVEEEETTVVLLSMPLAEEGVSVARI